MGEGKGKKQEQRITSSRLKSIQALFNLILIIFSYIHSFIHSCIHSFHHWDLRLTICVLLVPFVHVSIVERTS